MISAIKLIFNTVKIVEPKYKLRIYLNIFLSIFSSSLDLLFYTLIANYYSLKTINLPILNITINPLIRILITILIISFLRFLTLYSTVTTSALIGSSVHLSLLYSYIKSPFKDFKENEKSFYLDKLSKHVEYFNLAFHGSLLVVSTSLVILFSSIYVLLNSSSLFIFLAALAVLLFFLLSRYTKNKLVEVSKNYNKSLSNLISLNSHLLSSYTNLFFRQSHQLEVERIVSKSIRTYRNGTSIAYYSSLSKYLLEPILIIASLIIIFNFTEISSNGSNIAVIVSILRAVTVLQTLFYGWSTVTGYSSFADSVFKDISCKFEKEKNKPVYAEEKNNTISCFEENYSKLDLIKIKNVSLRFENKKFIFKDLNNTFPTGISILQGKNGEGKSTLFNVITGLLEPCEGSVFINDVQIWPYPKSKNKLEKRFSVIKKISYLSQDVYIYSGTILENITGKNFIDKNEKDFLKKLIINVDLKNIIGDELKGLHRICGDNGTNLSGGQKQRVALARELYRKPNILFLDESLSAIDKLTQKQIFEGIIKFDFIKSVFFITHDNIDWINNAYKYELSNGKLSEKKS